MAIFDLRLSNGLKAAFFGCHEGQLWTGGKSYDFDKPWDCVRWNARCEVARLVDLPKRIRLRLSDYLCSIANYLRGEPSIEGFYGIRTNKAGSIGEDLRFALICAGEQVIIEKDDCDELLDKVEELERLAKASWWQPTFLDWPQQIRETQSANPARI